MRAEPAVTPPKGKAARQQKYAHRPITGAPDKTAACRAKPLPAADKPKNQNRARPPQRPCRRQAASIVAHRSTLVTRQAASIVVYHSILAVDSVVSTTTLPHCSLPQGRLMSTVAYRSTLNRYTYSQLYPSQRPYRRQAASIMVHRSALPQAALRQPQPQSTAPCRKAALPPTALQRHCRPAKIPQFFPSAGRRPYQPSIPGVAGAVLWRNTSCALS